MQDADNIILQQLQDLGCSLDPEIKSIKQFDPDIVYNVCVHYLRVIDEAKAEALPEVLSKQMTTRVNQCTVLAAVIKEVGFRGEMGYQQILYPNEGDIRKLLIWFAQAGGKNKIITDGGGGGTESALIGESILKKLTAVAKEAWVPTRHKATVPFTSTPLRVPVRGRAIKTTPGLEKYYTQYLIPIVLQPPKPEHVPASVLEHNLELFAEAQERDNEWNTRGLTSGVNPEEYRKRKGDGINGRIANYLRPFVVSDIGKGAGEKSKDSLADLLESFEQTFQGQSQFVRKKNFINEEDTIAIVPQRKETEEERLKKQELEIEDLQTQLSHLEQEVSQVTQDAQSLVTTIRQLEAKLGEEEARRLTLEKEYKIKKKTMGLLEDAEKNIEELQSVTKVSAQRLLDLAGQWEERRVPLIEQYRKLRDGQMNKEDETKVMLEQVKSLRAQMKSWVAEIHQKDDHYKQLQEALDALPKDMSRAVYTRNILEIVKNVKKQKVDIDKILIDTRALQKEINTVSDTLGRVYTVVDEMVFADANAKDATAIQAYKQIALIDKNFKKLVAFIEETGQCRNNILNLESKIEQLQLRTNSLNTDRLEKDLAEVRAENQTLKAKLGQ